MGGLGVCVASVACAQSILSTAFVQFSHEHDVPASRSVWGDMYVHFGMCVPDVGPAQDATNPTDMHAIGSRFFCAVLVRLRVSACWHEVARPMAHQGL